MGTNGEFGIRNSECKGGAFRIPHSTFRTGKRGQSTLEYLLIVGVVLAAILALVNSVIKPEVTRTVNQSGAAIGKASDEFKAKFGL